MRFAFWRGGGERDRERREEREEREEREREREIEPLPSPLVACPICLCQWLAFLTPCKPGQANSSQVKDRNAVRL
jgi:hypothetical protein